MKTSALCREWLNTLPPISGGLERVQKIGRKTLKEIKAPDNKIESWRHSNLNRLTQFFTLPLIKESKKNQTVNLYYQPEIDKNIFQLFLHPCTNPLNNVSLPQGIRELNEFELGQYLGETLDLCNCHHNWPVVFNKAVTSNVLGLHIQGDNIPPIEIIIPNKKDFLNTTRLILIVEQNTSLELLQIIHGDHNSASNHISELKIKSNAKVNHGVIALGEGEESSLLSTIAIEQEKDSHYCLTAIQKGWNFSRFEPRLVQAEGNAHTELKGLQVTSKKEEISTHSFIKFNGPKGNLEQLQKGLADNASHSIFNGSIQVPKDAQETQASQLSRNIILSNRARVDTKPELEIVADNVKCTHGATVSQLQEEELFYLRSRGIDNQHANSLLIQGYYNDILSSLPGIAERWSLIKQLISN